jgi:hypothetical protein
MNKICYLQIFESKKVCQTFPSDTKTYIFLTPQKEYLKKNGLTDTPFISQQTNIKILATFSIPFDTIINVFKHSNDRILDVVIENKMIKIIGDNEKIIFVTTIDFDENVERKPLTLYATKNFLFSNNLPYF